MQIIINVFRHGSVSLVSISLEFNLATINIEDAELEVFLIIDDIDGLQLVVGLVFIVGWVIGVVFYTTSMPIFVGDNRYFLIFTCFKIFDCFKMLMFAMIEFFMP